LLNFVVRLSVVKDMSIRSELIMCSLVLAIVGSAQTLPPVRKILDRYEQSAGGRKSWLRVKTIRREGVALPGLGDFALQTAADTPGNWHFTLQLSSVKVIGHGANDERGWESSPAPKSMTAEQWLEESLLYNPFLVLKLHDYFPNMTVKGRVRNGEHEVWVVEAVPREGRGRTLYFDVRTGLLTRAGKVMFDDYRSVQGVKVPFLTRYGWQTLKYGKVSVNGPVNTSVFQAPPIPATVPAEAMPTVASIIDRYLSAVGGEAAIRKIHSQVRKGTGREGGESFEVETTAKTSGKWMLVFRAGGQIVDKQVCDSAAAWTERGGSTRDLAAGNRAESESLFEVDLLSRLTAHERRMKVTRREIHGEREVYVIESEPASGGPGHSRPN
jgi:hypothetical protein